MTERFELDRVPPRELLSVQDGVVARWQLLEAGALLHDIERMVRRRELRRVHPGVFVNHTGPLTQRQREWAAVLTAWPAALAGASALPGPAPGNVQIAIARGRAVRLPEGVEVRHVSDLDDRVLWHRAPPRVRIEHATIDEMSKHIRAGAVAAGFATLARVAQSRRTTVDRILIVLASRRRVAGRAMIVSMLSDLRDGVCSVLERGYRDNVERVHGLPTANRQHESSSLGIRTHQDVRYRQFGLVVELDGLAFHGDAAARDDDAARDLAELAASGAPTARVTYGLAFTTPCRTARWIAEILHHRGWAGELKPCPRCTQGPAPR
ncbi:hypothetical protein [Occultella kanbiaonis]|uniref:hypothetical protein n=1 Tax=Occultella kanbiaonis TaxID=2675754 RepID=UPI0012B903D3|nr:hypothetical protein [Occultella kanbiaonis]